MWHSICWNKTLTTHLLTSSIWKELKDALLLLIIVDRTIFGHFKIVRFLGCNRKKPKIFRKWLIKTIATSDRVTGHLYNTLESQTNKLRGQKSCFENFELYQCHRYFVATQIVETTLKPNFIDQVVFYFSRSQPFITSHVITTAENLDLFRYGEASLHLNNWT